ncbi:hypothetical protein QNO07_02370 [Streptomyces sp. 549]|uniref:hypothetical protein n=1 Tax=Streptomyces sp. 549 TaxID=3049076 RepID=UPI0024C42C97|nr:hypothetical protein [Streptomyces sp. 549]MDK1472280.1 hypothetical protein [Streptomyces sp. 549]
MTAPPERDGRELAVWAVARMAAALAEDTAFEADVTCVERGGTSIVTVAGTSAAMREREGGDPGVAALFDPAALLCHIGSLSARHSTRIGRRCVELELVPHPVWAQGAEGPWTSPEAEAVRLALDTATGFLLEADTPWRDGEPSHYTVTSLATPDPVAPTSSTPPARTYGAGWALGRMAATLLEPAVLTAHVTLDADVSDLEASTSAPTSDRTWAVTVTGTDSVERQLVLGDDPDPHAPGAVRRLTELLTPARIVGHLRRVHVVPGSGGRSVQASVRPMRTFPMSAWAPDEEARCRFTVDPATGVLTEATTHLGADCLARYRVTGLSR